jgi:hypothetical protein
MNSQLRFIGKKSLMFPMQPLIWHEKITSFIGSPSSTAGMQHSSWSFEKVIQDYCASTCLRCACDRIGHAFLCDFSGMSWGWYLKSWIQHDRMTRRKKMHIPSLHIQTVSNCWFCVDCCSLCGRNGQFSNPVVVPLSIRWTGTRGPAPWAHPPLQQTSVALKTYTQLPTF